MVRTFPLLLALTLASPVMAQVPIQSVPPAAAATSTADRSDPAAWQAAMPSIEIVAGFLAERDIRGEDDAHIPRADNAFVSGEEVYFYVSLGNVARDPVGQPGARFQMSLRAQVRSDTGEPLSPWLDIHTYEGTMTMAPDDPEYFQSWITGGLGPEVPPGRYQLALEFTDDLRVEEAAQTPVEIVFDLVYPAP
ncbi:hypothetical protein [Gymnodinialimonas hymeniacidonis]|uniref:hypothetical protein n=1 Tax=Gymnodinialimonas hymeniacidonis TaxID=3126508 RepID=UPI0034C5DC91